MNARASVTAAALLLGASLAQGQADFTTYVAVGDSLTAGYSNGSLVEGHQAFSYPLDLARQAGVAGTFQQPIISDPGIPTELTLVSLSGPTILPKTGRQGEPINLGLTRPYNNLAVPGAISLDALLDKGNNKGSISSLILRGQGSQVEQALALHPTFVTLWIGNNDVLGAAIRGRAIDGVTLTPKAVFRQTYGAIVAQLRGSGARMVAGNLPDVTSIPFVNTIPPYLVDPITRQPVLIGGQRVPLIGPGGPLAPSTLVTLAASSFLAQGVGIPAAVPGGKGTPLPDEVLLDAGEVAIIQDYVAANNQAIQEICSAAGIPVVDFNRIFREIRSSGRRVGGVTVTADFLTGGLIGYDGVHATDLGYALVANEWIDVINQNGGSLQPVDLLPYLGLSTSRTARAPSQGAPVFSREAWEQLLAVFPTVDGR